MKKLTMITALVWLATGCAGNTLQQDMTYTAWANCQADGRIASQAQLTRVEPDGRYWMFGLAGSFGFGEAQKCMNEQFAKMRQAPPAISTKPASTPAGAVATAGIVKPDWKVGDEWAYRQESPSGSITFFWSVDGIESIDGVEHYVVKSGTRQTYFRRADGGITMQKVSGDVVNRYTPPWIPIAWPLTVGRTWESRFTEERVQDRQTSEITRSCEALAEETITVPAGTFSAIRIVCRNQRTGGMVYEQWYAPVIKQLVREVWQQQGGARTRELIAYKLK